MRDVSVEAALLGAFEKAIVVLEGWVDESGSKPDGAGLDAIEEIVAFLRKSAVADASSRSEAEKRLLFVGYFYRADLERTGTTYGLGTMPDELALSASIVERLAEEYEHNGVLEKHGSVLSEASYRITPYGREWFEGELAGPSDARPWWMARDDQNQRWPNLGSRPAYDRDIARALEEATEHRPLCLLFIDFDNLKRLNSEFGNPKADRSLGAVIEVLAEVAHAKGRPYLYGNGDEFALLLPNVSLGEGMATGERVCSAVRSLKIEGLPSPTVSIGVSCFPMHGKTPESIAEAANGAQRDAKARGKDRVVSALNDLDQGRGRE